MDKTDYKPTGRDGSGDSTCKKQGCIRICGFCQVGHIEPCSIRVGFLHVLQTPPKETLRSRVEFFSEARKQFWTAQMWSLQSARPLSITGSWRLMIPPPLFMLYSWATSSKVYLSLWPWSSTTLPTMVQLLQELPNILRILSAHSDLPVPRRHHRKQPSAATTPARISTAELHKDPGNSAFIPGPDDSASELSNLLVKRVLSLVSPGKGEPRVL
ncbi:hypothetical protein Q5P01_012214 [Channa striata]|uniref:Uncharacterized protein n=1 Tax=Channa striata TaxID=64152 RepID=A0AA88MRB0_CHASR|nr:hypothetical protein Q5P01_012214 [Channa striata]